MNATEDMRGTTITVSEASWQWAQDAALLLAALRMVGVEQWPGYAEAQQMVAGQPAPAHQAETAALARLRVRVLGRG